MDLVTALVGGQVLLHALDPVPEVVVLVSSGGAPVGSAGENKADLHTGGGE
ncbi:MAG: hypothetical protein ACYTF1_06585 [Planctomycetota bacterium]